MKILWVIHVASQAQLFPKSSLPGNLSQHLLKKSLVFLDLKEKTDLTYYIHRHTFLSQTRTNHFLDSKMLVFFVVDFILIFTVQLECSNITKSNRGYIISPWVQVPISDKQLYTISSRECCSFDFDISRFDSTYICRTFSIMVIYKEDKQK